MSELDQTDAADAEAPDPVERGMPRWVRAFIAIAAVLVVVFVATKLLGMDHGPGRHGGGDPPAADNGNHTSPLDH